jgi:multidrug efflux pump
VATHAPERAASAHRARRQAWQRATDPNHRRTGRAADGPRSPWADYVNYLSQQGRSYRVIPQVERAFRLTPEQLTHYRVRTRSGELVPISTIVELRESVRPRQLLRFNQLNSATLSGVPAPGVPLGEAVDFLQQAAGDVLPAGYVTDWAGESRQYIQKGSALVTAFFLSAILIYVTLAALYESFRDPAVMFISIPMSLAGAPVFFALGVVSVNIYTQIGLLALIGSIIRHGILLVEFGNQAQEEEGLDRRGAIERAAATGFRAVMMTTIATPAGMIPLLLASGPGAESRFAIGFVLGAGMALGTLFTLFMVPALYTVVARERGGEAAEGPWAADPSRASTAKTACVRGAAAAPSRTSRPVSRWRKPWRRPDPSQRSAGDRGPWWWVGR